MRGQEHGAPFSETATGTAQAIATHSAVAGKTFYVTEVSGSADVASGAAIANNLTIVVKQGTTAIWQDLMPLVTSGSSNSLYQKTFNVPLAGVSGGAVSVTVGTANSASRANIAGYEL